MAQLAEIKRDLTVEEPESAGKKNIYIENDSLADVTGGMGRHLGVFSCTMLMYVLSYPIPTHY